MRVLFDLMMYFIVFGAMASVCLYRDCCDLAVEKNLANCDVAAAYRRAPMTSRKHHRLTATGFSLLYAASMGSLVLFSMPYFHGLETELLLYGALPAAIAGIAIIAFEKMRTPSYPEWP